MKRKTVWLILSCLIVVALVLVSCRPVAKEEGGKTVVGKVVEKEEKVVEKEKKEVVSVKEGPVYGGTLTFAIPTPPLHFDPYFGLDEPSYTAQSYYLEEIGVGDWAANREKCPFQSTYCPLECARGLLAESWETPDLLTIVFHIRKGVRWQNKPPLNGRELTAKDIEYSWHRMLALGSGFTKPCPYIDKPKWAAIESITATDKYTVVFKLSKPDNLLLEQLVVNATGDFIVAREAVELYGDLEDWRHAVGTGPFIFEDYVTASSYTVRRNPAYWGWDERHPENKIPYVDKVLTLVVPDLSTRLAALRTGKTDVMAGIQWEQAESLKKSNPELKWVKSRSAALAFSIRCDLQPYTDIRVRRALQMAIDLPTIAKDYYGGNADPFPSICNANLGGVWAPLEEYPKEVQKAFTYHPEKAKQLLTEAGYPNGFKCEVGIGSTNLPMLDLAEMTKGYWKDSLNVDLEIKVYEQAAATAIAYGRQYEHFIALWTAMSAIPISCLRYYYPGVAWNFSMVNDPVYNAMLDAIPEEPDPVKRTRLAREANIYGSSQHWYIAFPVQHAFTFWQPWVKEYSGELYLSLTNRDAIPARVWIDTDLKYKLTGQRQ